MTDNNKESNSFVAKICSGLIVFLSLIAGIWAYPNLPERVPSHWNIAGEVNGYTTQLGGAFLLPLMMLAIYGLFFLLPRIDPKKMNYAKMGRVFWFVGFATILFLGIIYIGTLAVALGYVQTLSSKWILSSIGILFLIMGNYFGKIKPNYTFGIRTPWTLASEEVWIKTHRFAGPIWIIGGILLLVTGFLPIAWATPWLIGIIGIIVVVPIAYSFVVFQRLSK